HSGQCEGHPPADRRIQGSQRSGALAPRQDLFPEHSACTCNGECAAAPACVSAGLLVSGRRKVRLAPVTAPALAPILQQVLLTGALLGIAIGLSACDTSRSGSSVKTPVDSSQALT